MSLLTALYASLICTFVGWFNYGMHEFGIKSPIISGAIVGLFLGDLQTGIIIGGALTLIYLGVVGVGAAIPISQQTATTVSVALVILTGADQTTAIALAVPVAVLGQLDRMVAWLINSTFMHLGDKYIENGDINKIARLSAYGSLIFWVAEFIPVFLCIYLGSQFVGNINEIIPTWVNNWLTATTSMLPALGFGMLFVMMYKTKYLPYFIIGFVLTVAFGGSLQAVSLIGLSLALPAYFKNKEAL